MSVFLTESIISISSSIRSVGRDDPVSSSNDDAQRNFSHSERLTTFIQLVVSKFVIDFFAISSLAVMKGNRLP
jgi:hypothetical protein